MVELNPHLTCVLCGGYFIDATTIIECLHSFCRTCIVRYLWVHKMCPVCDVQVHKTRPLLNIRSDQTLQDIVYKLVPGLFKNEMRRRREFYSRLPESARTALPASSEERGDVRGVERLIFAPEDRISVSLEYSARDVLPIRPLLVGPTEVTEESPPSSRRYLCCPGGFTVGHLKKFLRAKFGLARAHEVDVMYVHDHLLEEYSLMDLAYIYSWRRNAPMRLRYRFPDLHTSLSTESRDKEVVPTAPNDGKTIVIAAPSGAPCPQTTETPQPPSPRPNSKPAAFQYSTPNKPSAKTPTPPPQLPKAAVPHPAVPHPAVATTPPARKNGVVASNGVHPNLRHILPASATGVHANLRHILPAPAKTPTTNGVGGFTPKATDKNNRVTATVPGGIPALSAAPAERRQDESPAAKRPHLDSRQCNEAVAS